MRMNANSLFSSIACFGVLATFTVLYLTDAPAVAAESVTYKGTGTYVATRTTMPLASGGAVVHITNSVVATIEPSESGFMAGDCAGLGFISESGDYQADLYCTFSVVGGDSFDLRAKTGTDDGSVEIIGGTGIWDGATGTGTIIRRYADGPNGSYDYSFDISKN